MPFSVEQKWAVLDGPEMKRDLLLYDISIDPREVARYGLSEVALFLHIPENTLRSWVSGRTFPKVKGEGFSAPLINPADGEGSILSFFNLTEAHILKSTRQRDEVPMKEIRAAIDYVTEQFPSAHPLITQEFLTDGRFLFLKKLSDLINASKMGQLGIEPILKDYLSRIDRDTQGLPITIYPVIPKKPTSRSVAIRYGVSSGAPVVSGTGVLVSVLWGRFKAGDSTQDLAFDYDLRVEQIEDAIAYLEAA